MLSQLCHGCERSHRSHKSHRDPLTCRTIGTVHVEHMLKPFRQLVCRERMRDLHMGDLRLLLLT